MRKYYIGLCALLLTIGTVRMAAQTEEPRDIVVTNFQNVVTDLSASVTSVNDNNGDVCAVIKFFVRDTTFVIEPNLGYLRRESKVGEIRLWVPAGTKRLTVRHEGMFPLKDYAIPMPIESKKAYHAFIEEKRKSDKKTQFFLGAGYMVAPQSGLSFSAGVNANHHIVEAGVALALGKTDSLHYYESSTWLASYQYSLLKTSLKYGYEIQMKEFGKNTVACTPSLGIQSAISLGSGENGDKGKEKKEKFKNGMAMSICLATRFSLIVGDNFAVFVKPEYSIAAYKSDSYKLMMQGNDKFKKWAEGFSLDAGVVVMF